MKKCKVLHYAAYAIPVIVTLAIPIAILIIIIYNSLYIHGEKLIIDHDAGADDAMAIFMALLAERHHKGPKVIALTTTHGNVNEDQAFINSQRILNIAGRSDVSIYRGSNRSIIKDMPSDHYFGKDGLGDMENVDFNAIPAQNIHAAVALVHLSKIYKGDLVIVSIGAITNLALAIRLDPDFLGRLKHLYLGAGHLHSKTFPKPEFNAEQDAEAYYIAVQDSKPDLVTVIPFSQTIVSMNVTKEWRVEVLGDINTRIIQALNDFESVSMSKITNGIWSLLDPVVMAAYLDNNIVKEYKYSNNGIILCGKERGVTTNEFVSKEKANVRLLYSAKEDAYKNLLLKLFST